MITDEEIDDFLEHFGVRGMRWGVRRAQNHTSFNKTFKTRPLGQKVGITYAGGGAAFATAVLASRLGVRPIISIAGGTGVGILTQHAVANILDKHGDKKASSIKKKK